METEMQPYVVYAKTDETGRIVGIDSSAFLIGTDGWTEIDRGYGIRYRLAQGNYFPRPIMDERGICRYKLADGKPVERTASEMEADYVPPQEKPSLESRVETVENDTGELKEALDLILSGVTE